MQNLINILREFCLFRCRSCCCCCCSSKEHQWAASRNGDNRGSKGNSVDGRSISNGNCVLMFLFFFVRFRFVPLRSVHFSPSHSGLISIHWNIRSANAFISTQYFFPSPSPSYIHIYLLTTRFPIPIEYCMKSSNILFFFQYIGWLMSLHTRTVHSIPFNFTHTHISTSKTSVQYFHFHWLYIFALAHRKDLFVQTE